MKTKILMTAILASIVMTAAAAQEQAPDRHERPAFSTLDTDGDGSVTLAEMQARGDARFAEVDTDGDGGLSEAELTASANDRATDRVTRMLEEHDANGDGVLQPSEMPQRSDDRTARMFEHVDADSDGAITEAEFEAAKDGMGGRKGHRDRG